MRTIRRPGGTRTTALIVLTTASALLSLLALNWWRRKRQRQSLNTIQVEQADSKIATPTAHEPLGTALDKCGFDEISSDCFEEPHNFIVEHSRIFKSWLTSRNRYLAQIMQQISSKTATDDFANNINNYNSLYFHFSNYYKNGFIGFELFSLLCEESIDLLCDFCDFPTILHKESSVLQCLYSAMKQLIGNRQYLEDLMHRKNIFNHKNQLKGIKKKKTQAIPPDISDDELLFSILVALVFELSNSLDEILLRKKKLIARHGLNAVKNTNQEQYNYFFNMINTMYNFEDHFECNCDSKIQCRHSCTKTLLLDLFKIFAKIYSIFICDEVKSQRIIDTIDQFERKLKYLFDNPEIAEALNEKVLIKKSKILILELRCFLGLKV